MAVFDKTESLVMMPLCSAFTAADKTDVLVAFYGGEAASSCPRSGQLRTPNKKELPDKQKSRHQDNVSRSTLEAECVVASQAGQEERTTRRNRVASPPHNQFWDSVIFRAI
jgi:hypothetical protein